MNISLYIDTKNLFVEIDRLADRDGLSSLEWGGKYISEISGISSKYFLLDIIAFYYSSCYKSGSLPPTVEILLDFDKLMMSAGDGSSS